MLRAEEKFAQKAFEKFLGNATSKEGPNPPDLEFEVTGAQWAVEVTTFHQYLVRDGVEASRTQFEAQVAKIRERLEQGLPPNRGYVFCVGSWLSNADLKKLEEWAQKYIAADGTLETQFKGNEQIWIQADEEPSGKVHMIAGILDHMQVPDKNQSLNADIRATIDYGAKRIIEDKAPKLGKLTRYERRILLISNDRVGGYPFLTPENLRVALRGIPIPGWLQGGIYLVEGDGSVNLLA